MLDLHALEPINALAYMAVIRVVDMWVNASLCIHRLATKPQREHTCSVPQISVYSSLARCTAL